MPTRSCDRCGKTYTYERSTSKFCSTNCRVAFASKDRMRVPDDLRYYILERDHFHCRACGDAPKPTKTLRVDHMTPVAMGGSLLDPENLVTLCQACNSGKGVKVLTWDMLPDFDEDE